MTASEREQGAAHPPQVMNLGAYWLTIRRSPGVFFGTFAAVLLVAFLFLHMTKFYYTITYQVSPISDQSKGALGSGLSDLASMAGVNIGGSGEADPFELYLQGLYTRETAVALAKNQQLMQAMFPDEWDADAHRWHDASPIWNGAAAAGMFVLGIPQRPYFPPDGARLQQFILERVHVTRDLKTPVVTIDFKWPHPDAAALFLNALSNTVDDDLRARSLERTRQYIAYLKEQLATVTMADYRQALIQLVAGEEKQRMFAGSSLSYAADIFQKPAASRWPTTPSPGFVMSLAVFFGLLLAAMVSIAWERGIRASALRLRTGLGVSRLKPQSAR